jgi:hypothetical protein
MPKQRVGDIEIFYEVHGNGPQTLVMVCGLGSNLCAWYEQTRSSRDNFRTVVSTIAERDAPTTLTRPTRCARR